MSDGYYTVLVLGTCPDIPPREWPCDKDDFRRTDVWAQRLLRHGAVSPIVMLNGEPVAIWERTP